jgi:hypothetical protein
LDFDPGTKWQYSNTNYVIAGRIVELLSGEPLFRFLQIRIFTPLRMTSVYNTDLGRLGDTDAQGYFRYALGPLRPAPKELLSPESYKEMFTSVKLKDDADTHYGLGVFTAPRDGHAALEHDGEVSGFVSENIVFPDDHAAVTLLTNEDVSSAAQEIGRDITPLLLGSAAPSHGAEQALAQARSIFAELQNGMLDRSLFTANANTYFAEQAIHDFASSLKPLGAPTSFTEASERLRGGMTFRAFLLGFNDPKTKLVVTTYTVPRR